MAKPLEITFHGPFVFRFGREYAWAYAPRCDEHYLNILTDREDVTLPIDKETNERIRTFEMTGPTPGKTVSKSTCLIITYPWKKTWPNTERHWNYVLSFPAPDYIYGLVPEYVWIYGYPDSGEAKEAHYARALRFRYNDSPIPPQFNEIGSEHFSATHLGGTDPHYSIEIRYTHYHSVALKKEDYFSDAQSCFESMREKLWPCDTWKAFFGEDPDTLGVRSKSLVPPLSGGPNGPHDCGAAVMALGDGISLKPKTQSENSIRVSRRKSEKNNP
jgi:hypothetical protein